MHVSYVNACIVIDTASSMSLCFAALMILPIIMHSQVLGKVDDNTFWPCHSLYQFFNLIFSSPLWALEVKSYTLAIICYRMTYCSTQNMTYFYIQIVTYVCTRNVIHF